MGLSKHIPKVHENGIDGNGNKSTAVVFQMPKMKLIITMSISVVFTMLLTAGGWIWNLAKDSSRLDKLEESIISVHMESLAYFKGEQESEALRIAKQNVRATTALLRSIKLICEKDGIIVPYEIEDFYDQ